MAKPALRTAVTDLPPYVPGRRAQSALAAALASNESHYPPLESVVKVVAEAAGRLNRYPEISSIELRERLAEHVGVTAAEIAVGPGSVGVLQQIITAMCDAGDEVVFAWRSFEAYPIVVGLAGAVAVPVPLRDEGHDLAAMLNAVTARTRVVLLCSPNNPTGVAITASELETFLDQVPPQVLVVIDEAYFEYAGTPEIALSAYRRHPNVCVLRTFSKAYGLAGLRVGYAIASPELADGLRRTAIPFGVTSIAQQAAIASLDAYEEMRERVVPVIAERQRMTAVLRSNGWSIPDSSANFIWIRTTATLREHLLSAFAAEDILVRGYPNDGIRITVADPKTNDRVYSLNHEHLAAAAVVELATLRARLIRRIMEAIGQWPHHPIHASIFGSAARGDGDLDSDVDFLIVHGFDEPPPEWSEQLDELGDRVHAWTGNFMQTYELSTDELAEHLRVREPIVDEWLRDCLTVYGLDFRRLRTEISKDVMNR